jgi:MerR family transcriptional regulator, heat shock protein HspR
VTTDDALRVTARLDDEDYPALTMGQACELLGVQAAFLRSLDAAGLLEPHRSEGGHRRYSRRQLDHAARIRALSDEGHTIAGAAMIIGLRDDLAAAEALRHASEQQRDVAQEQREAAEEQRDVAREQRDAARAERDAAREDVERLERDLDELRAHRDADTRARTAG